MEMADCMEMSETAQISPRQQPASEFRFAAILTGIFLAAAIFNVSHHAMWRDETRVWQIAAASPNLSALRKNLRYEGAPILWYLIVWPLTRLTGNMLAMQLAHVTIAAAVVFTFAIAAPFGRVIRVLFAFGYFPFFEYATITRSYSLEFLLFLIGAAIASGSRPRPILLAIVLAALRRSASGAGFAGLLVIVAMLRRIVQAPREQRRATGMWMMAFAIVLASCLLCYAEATPGPGKFYIITWPPSTTDFQKLAGSIGTVWKGWMPIPLWQTDYWNTNILDDYYLTHFVLACIFLPIAVLCLLRSLGVLLLLVAGLGGQMAFTYYKFCGITGSCSWC